jgi:hypothetical protein
MRNPFKALGCIALLIAFATPALANSVSQGKIIVDNEKIVSEVLEAQNKLISLYKQGKFLDALAVDLDSDKFRCIKNGKIETYDELAARYRKMVADNQVKRMDYEIDKQHFNVRNSDNVLTTLSVNLTITMSDGSSIVQDSLGETVLWQRVDGAWRLAHYHASDSPKQ